MAASKPEFILASTSPRRIRLLREQGYRFKVMSPDFDEDNRAEHPSPAELAAGNSRNKGLSIAAPPGNKKRIVLSADTIVVLKNSVLGKPVSAKDALNMLLALNNSRHSVITAYTIIRQEKGQAAILAEGLVESFVSFGNFSPDHFKKYVKTGEPQGKAGAYAIQETGARFIDRVEGSYTNIVGLPLFEVMRDLNAAGIQYPWK